MNNLITNIFKNSCKNKKEKICPKCGFISKHQILGYKLCYSCGKDYLSISEKSKRKYIKIYKKNPLICPKCKQKLKLGKSIHYSDTCPSCGYEQLKTVLPS